MGNWGEITTKNVELWGPTLVGVGPCRHRELFQDVFSSGT